MALLMISQEYFYYCSADVPVAAITPQCRSDSVLQRKSHWLQTSAVLYLKNLATVLIRFPLSLRLL